MMDANANATCRVYPTTTMTLTFSSIESDSGWKEVDESELDDAGLLKIAQSPPPE